jgi:hypothetical protein
MPAFQLCATFDLFPDDTQILTSFSLAGFDFTTLGSNPKIFINTKGNECGLKFPNNGIEIVLPIPLPTVNLRLGTFGGPVDISTADSSGSVVRKRNIPELDRYINVRLSAHEIASIVLTGGGNEAVLSHICVAVSVC